MINPIQFGLRITIWSDVIRSSCSLIPQMDPCPDPIPSGFARSKHNSVQRIRSEFESNSFPIRIALFDAFLLVANWISLCQFQHNWYTHKPSPVTSNSFLRRSTAPRTASASKAISKLWRDVSCKKLLHTRSGNLVLFQINRSSKLFSGCSGIGFVFFWASHNTYLSLGKKINLIGWVWKSLCNKIG